MEIQHGRREIFHCTKAFDNTAMSTETWIKRMVFKVDIIRVGYLCRSDITTYT